MFFCTSLKQFIHVRRRGQRWGRILVYELSSLRSDRQRRCEDVKDAVFIHSQTARALNECGSVNVGKMIFDFCFYRSFGSRRLRRPATK